MKGMPPLNLDAVKTRRLEKGESISRIPSSHPLRTDLEPRLATLTSTVRSSRPALTSSSSYLGNANAADEQMLIATERAFLRDSEASTRMSVERSRQADEKRKVMDASSKLVDEFQMMWVFKLDEMKAFFSRLQLQLEEDQERERKELEKKLETTAFHPHHSSYVRDLKRMIDAHLKGKEYEKAKELQYELDTLERREVFEQRRERGEMEEKKRRDLHLRHEEEKRRLRQREINAMAKYKHERGVALQTLKDRVRTHDESLHHASVMEWAKSKNGKCSKPDVVLDRSHFSTSSAFRGSQLLGRERIKESERHIGGGSSASSSTPSSRGGGRKGGKAAVNLILKTPKLDDHVLSRLLYPLAANAWPTIE